MPRKPEMIEGLAAKGVDYRDDGDVDIQTVSETKDMRKLFEDEKFMEERVKLLVMPTTDPNASPFVHLSVNGEGVTLFRNVPSLVKRKHLEVLARMKETRVSQDMAPNASGEITVASLRGHTGLAYPFTTLEDKNPRGGAWLAHVLAEPA